MIEDAARLISKMAPAARKAFNRAYDLLTIELGCAVHVKTIYIGFSYGPNMVAAAYPHPGEFEIALALPEKSDDPLLRDATHLTWRTLPVSLIVRSTEDADRLAEFIREAARRVEAGVHEVNRPIEDFATRSRRLRSSSSDLHL